VVFEAGDGVKRLSLSSRLMTSGTPIPLPYRQCGSLVSNRRRASDRRALRQAEPELHGSREALVPPAIPPIVKPKPTPR
jgi:hypothetical protein